MRKVYLPRKISNIINRRNEVTSAGQHETLDRYWRKKQRLEEGGSVEGWHIRSPHQKARGVTKQEQ